MTYRPSKKVTRGSSQPALSHGWSGTMHWPSFLKSAPLSLTAIFTMERPEGAERGSGFPSVRYRRYVSSPRFTGHPLNVPRASPTLPPSGAMSGLFGFRLMMYMYVFLGALICARTISIRSLHAAGRFSRLRTFRPPARHERFQELLHGRRRDIYPFVAAAVVHEQRAIFDDSAGGVHNARFPIVLVPFARFQNRSRGAIEDFCRVINIKEHGADFVADMLLGLHSVV